MPRTIYAADDDPDIREILWNFLTNAGYEVSLFPTGDDLLSAFLQRPCDLVLLDIMMPGTDGLSICRHLRKNSDVPIYHNHGFYQWSWMRTVVGGHLGPFLF